MSGSTTRPQTPSRRDLEKQIRELEKRVEDFKRLCKTMETERDEAHEAASTTIAFPLGESAGYDQRHVKVRLTPKLAGMLSELRDGLTRTHAQTSEGRHVENNVDAIRYLIEASHANGVKMQSGTTGTAGTTGTDPSDLLDENSQP